MTATKLCAGCGATLSVTATRLVEATEYDGNFPSSRIIGHLDDGKCPACGEPLPVLGIPIRDE